ncbi:MAG: transposase [Proteobacteria bacterium]|nr:MAG: transposase [Pseudomonadota bacterium]
MKDVGNFSKIFICTGPVDFRKRSYGLTAVVKSALGENPIDPKSLFIFSNRRRTGMRMLYWDLTGFALWSKTLEKDSYKWPDSDSSGKLLISQKQLKWLLQGVDISQIKMHQPLEFASID